MECAADKAAREIGLHNTKKNGICQKGENNAQENRFGNRGGYCPQ